ncbi:hypothetical protein NQ314_010104 [Rhamnusium bicolor]|uniref:DDE-1 domain-containing protein n=1 Tax=Rhamnusium bicolor TaxID=1586634 RepID=A0AAV8XT38_9CUCU|nr:hypothetical protein NQ314_010104 [Rhamnusium bicolor]
MSTLYGGRLVLWLYMCMPRNYVRKTVINSYNKESLQNALNAVINDGRKIREVGRCFNIPESTLRKKISLNQLKTSRLGRKPVFTEELEAELTEYLAGKDWLYGFLKRNPKISLTQPEGTSLNRIAAFNADETKRFYSNLKNVIEKFKFQANRIFNMDETGLTTVQKKCPKVYGPKGVKKVGAAISAERGRTITAVFCMSASGYYIPPMLIYPRKRMAPTLQKNGPIGASYMCSKNGWINSELFLDWLHHFQKHVKPTESDPILLVLDNCSSHISIEAYNFCRENHIHMVSLPPHTSGNFQPLDLTFFSPFKNALYREYDLYLTSAGHEKITDYDLAELLNKAFMKLATMEKAVSGFRCSGIYPLDPDKFNENDFAPAKQMSEFLIVESPCKHRTPNSSPTPETPPNPSNRIHNSPIPECQENLNSPKDQQASHMLNGQPPPPPFKAIYHRLLILKKQKKLQKVSCAKQHSEILTSTPIKERLEEAQEKKRQKDAKLKNKQTRGDARKNAHFSIPAVAFYGKGQSKKTVKKTLVKNVCRRVCQSPETKVGRRKKNVTPESSDLSDVEDSDICDDDELDDINLSSVPCYEKPEEQNEICGICGELGKDELWYRCITCGSWHHAECTAEDSAVQYICDFCKE